jgi:hypothetical protein
MLFFRSIVTPISLDDGLGSRGRVPIQPHLFCAHAATYSPECGPRGDSEYGGLDDVGLVRSSGTRARAFNG